MATITHPQGAVREVPETEVDSYLTLGWERAEAPSDPVPDMSWLRDDIINYATTLGVQFDTNATKRDILKALNTHTTALAAED